MSVARAASFILASAAMVAGHGYVQGIVADGSYYGGYLVDSYPYQPSPPDLIAWSEQAKDLGFVDATGYSSPDIICHKESGNAKLSATIAAGGDVELQWTTWPESHHGPVINYLANCNGDCSTVDKNTLEWFKISESGLIDGSSMPGTWASDELISKNNSWTVTIPNSIAAGNYVLRHEIIALHSAGNENGAQNYPQCVNLKVTGGGSDSPSGTLGTELYTPTEDGILFNIYTPLDSYPIPGPALYPGGSGSSPTSSPPVIPTSTSGTSSTPVTPTSTPVASSTPITPTSTPAASSTPLEPSSTTQVSVTATASTETQVPQPTETITSTETETETIVPQPTATATQTQTQVVPPTPTNPSENPGTEPPTDISSLTEWFNSLSAEEFLTYLKATFSWLVTDKVHARSLE